MQDGTDVYREMNQRIMELLAQAKDPEYVVYLKNLQKRVIQQKYQADLLKEELDRSYVLYVNRMQGRQMEAVSQSPQAVSQAEMRAQSVQMDSQPQPVQMDSQPQPVQMGSQPQPVQMDSQPQPEQMRSQQQPALPGKKSTEFVFGATILSIVGALFIFAALVTMGMTFMGDLFKGIAFFVISLAVVILSEIVVVKKIPKFGMTLSAIGLGSTYISIIVNYGVWHNFNLWISFGMVLIMAIVAVVLSCKRHNNFYREFALIAGFISFLVMDYNMTDGEFLIITGLFFLLHVICLWKVKPEQKHLVSVVYTIANIVFTFIFSLRCLYGTSIEAGALIVFLLCSVGIQQVILVGNIHASHRKSTWILYYVADIMYMMLFSLVVSDGIEATGSNWYGYGTAIGLGVILSVTGVLLAAGKAVQELEHLYVCGMALLLVVLSCTNQIWVTVAALVIAVFLAKVLSLHKSVVLHVNDVILTAVGCIVACYMEPPYLYLLTAVLVLTLLFLHFFQTGFQWMIGATILVLCCRFLTGGLRMVVVMGVLFLTMLLFGSMERYRGRGQMIYFVSALTAQGICCLGLIHPKYQNAYIIYLCLLVFGVATIVFVVQETNHFSSKARYSLLLGFLTYMALVFQSNVSVVNSILLMVIALASVGIGFSKNRKPVRVYGLVLALLVCGKLALYDFLRAPTLQKTILFLVVGMIALSIAAVYIVLEKKNRR